MLTLSDNVTAFLPYSLLTLLVIKRNKKQDTIYLFPVLFIDTVKSSIVNSNPYPKTQTRA